MASLKSSQGVSVFLIAMLVCQAFVVPSLARTQVAPETKTQKTVSAEGYGGGHGGHDGYGHGGHDGYGHGGHDGYGHGGHDGYGHGGHDGYGHGDHGHDGGHHGGHH